ncbi:MAG: hypothetical protein NTV88_03585 [Candidatus Micrarchaeota archaeon]|nr:hypothetical protein [Candidatus Micrarchaeota archaeon]
MKRTTYHDEAGESVEADYSEENDAISHALDVTTSPEALLKAYETLVKEAKELHAMACTLEEQDDEAGEHVQGLFYLVLGIRLARQQKAIALKLEKLYEENKKVLR